VRPGLRTGLALACLAAATVAAAAAETARLRYVTGLYADDKGVPLRQPEAVACNDKAVAIVGDTGRGRLVRYTIDEREVKPGGAIAAAQVTVPIRLQLSSKDEIFALDGRQRRIGRFDAKGEFQGYVQPEGVPEPTTVVPRSFKLDRRDNIYVLDIFSARVLVLDPSGKYQRHVPLPPGYGFISDVAVDGKGTIYILDSVRPAVYAAAGDAKQFTRLGTGLQSHASFPTSLVADGRGVLYVADQNGAGIVVVGQDGVVLGRQLAMGAAEGLLYYPSQICVTEKGQMFIADRGNNRVQLFQITR
jgi:sugar lactone lactonase YvrE